MAVSGGNSCPPDVQGRTTDREQQVIFGGRTEKTTVTVAFAVAQESPFNYFFLFLLCHIMSELQKTLSAGWLLACF